MGTILVVLALALGLFYADKRLAAVRRAVTAHPALCNQCNRQLRFLEQGRLIVQVLTAALLLFGLAAWYHERYIAQRETADERRQLWPVYDAQKVWQAPDIRLAETDAHAKLIAYGRDLVARTQDYFGINGVVKKGNINGMNCQNCHLDAGTKPFGNNYFAVASTYPQQRARSGTLETIPKRINDCFQRSLNGQPLDTNGREMRAMIAYMEWLGTGVPKGQKPKGAGILDLPVLDRAADPDKGAVVFQTKCASCHGTDGQGLPMPDSPRRYPPLWGDHSYNEAAGLFRLSRFAGYVKANMPLGASYDNPQLSDEEAWDVAAFVNAQSRPKHPFLGTDWPNIAKKPFDHPFGPFADSFPERQHKFGPFADIKKFYKNTK